MHINKLITLGHACSLNIYQHRSSGSSIILLNRYPSYRLSNTHLHISIMCGRTAYSANSTAATARDLSNEIEKNCNGENNEEAILHRLEDPHNRQNSTPGQEYHIFRRSPRKEDANNDLDVCTAIWGLLPTHGTQNKPHLFPTNSNFSVSPHYTMFNARVETIYDKISFSNLIRNQQSCILAVDGYYEWTIESQSIDIKKKQPYFVCNKTKRPLLLAGLWTTVKTGHQIHNATTNKLEEETITTFTILTTDAHQNFKWLHPRQPIMLWNTEIAIEWLFNPTSDTVQKLRYIPINGSAEQSSIWDNELSVYPVSKKVNDSKYQGDDCTVEIKLEKVQSITSFFSPGGNKRVKTEDKKVDQKDIIPTSQIDDAQTKVEDTKKESIKESKDNASSSTTKSWACAVCTFMHTGQKFDYLVCEVCGSLRVHDTNNSEDATKNDDRGRKRTNI